MPRAASHSHRRVHGCTSRRDIIFRCRAAAIHRRPGAFRAQDPVGAGEPDRSTSRRLPSARVRHPARPSWACIFMKAYALVGAEHAPLRRSLLEFPWPRLYEHPWMNCALAIERIVPRRRGGLRRHLPGTRAADARPSSSRRWPGTRTRRWRRSASTAWRCGSARRRRRSGGSSGGAR